MDFYKLKATLHERTSRFLKAKEEGSKATWEEFCRIQARDLGVTQKLCLNSLHIVEPRLTVVAGEIVKV